MDKSKLEERYKRTLELKGRKQYYDTLKNELTKPEWQNELSKIAGKMNSISSEKDYGDAMKLLEKLFDRVCKKIAAPGLDKFIDWLNENSKNNSNGEKLRSILMEDYEKYSSKLDEITAAVETLPDENENYIFFKLITKFKAKQKKIITTFVSDSNSYVNNVDGFLSDLKTEYEGMSGITELSYKTEDELYDDEQKKDTTLSFYSSIIKKVVTEGQNLDYQNDDEKDQKVWELVRNRINSIKRCVSILQDTCIAEDEDGELKKLFIRFEDKMLNAKGAVDQVLEEYIEKKWNPIQDKYMEIKNFYKEDKLKFKSKEWEDFEKKADLDNLLLKYENVRNGDVLSKLDTTPLDKVAAAIDKCYKSIVELRELEETNRATIKKVFEDFYKQYDEKQPMLKKLVVDRPDLKERFDNMYSVESVGKYLPNIYNGIESLKENESLLSAMSNGTICDTLSDMKNATNAFVEILKQSQMEFQIDWINGFGEDTNIEVAKFNPQYLRDLLEKGLITLSFEKTF